MAGASVIFNPVTNPQPLTFKQWFHSPVTLDTPTSHVLAYLFSPPDNSRFDIVCLRLLCRFQAIYSVEVSMLLVLANLNYNLHIRNGANWPTNSKMRLLELSTYSIIILSTIARVHHFYRSVSYLIYLLSVFSEQRRRNRFALFLYWKLNYILGKLDSLSISWKCSSRSYTPASHSSILLNSAHG
jgi:hypothetical protein